MKIFIGPTGVELDLDGLEVRPPAQQGDIAAAALEGPDTLILIDGYFTQHLSPWHKEILFAIEKGCRVIGAGSLGALRAVECERFGAEPVGVIANWYKNEVCTDDSEVALAHSSMEDGYINLSVPLVNIRATVNKLQNERKTVLHEDAFIKPLANVFYMERSWQKIKSINSEMHDILKSNYVNQKQLDTIEAIKRAQTSFVPSKIAINFINYNMQGLLSSDLPVNGKRKWEAAINQDQAFDMHIIAEMACALGVKPTLEEIHVESQGMWRNLGITNPDEAADWMTKNGVDDKKWNMFAIKLALRQCVRNWFNSTEGGISVVPVAEECALFKTL
jgi:hypothetical protein